MLMREKWDDLPENNINPGIFNEVVLIQGTSIHGCCRRPAESEQAGVSARFPRPRGQGRLSARDQMCKLLWTQPGWIFSPRLFVSSTYSSRGKKAPSFDPGSFLLTCPSGNFTTSLWSKAGCLAIASSPRPCTARCVHHSQCFTTCKASSFVQSAAPQLSMFYERWGCICSQRREPTQWPI